MLRECFCLLNGLNYVCERDIRQSDCPIEKKEDNNAIHNVVFQNTSMILLDYV